MEQVTHSRHPHRGGDHHGPASAARAYLGRQPIVDRRRRTVAYELLYRGADDDRARVDDDAWATAQVIRRAFRELGIETVLGACEGFINVDETTLMGQSIEALPCDRVVLELLETLPIAPRIVRRCRELKDKGYRFALDDFVALRPCHQPLLEIADIVKIDIPQLDHGALERLVTMLRPYPARLLAEKVESLEVASHCLKLGFDLFQGFFFARPAILAA